MTTDLTMPEAPELAPESQPMGPWRWMKENLFSSRFNGFLTIFSVLGIAFFIRGILGFIFDPGRTWSAVGTNMRLYMTQAYPVEQFSRVWVSVAVIMALAGLSVAVWRVGGPVTVHRLTQSVQAGATLIAVFALLGPPDVTVETGIPVVGELVDFVLEVFALTGGRLIAFVVAAAVFLGAWATRRAYGARAKDVAVHSLLVVLVIIVGVLIALWTVPIGRYLFVEGAPLYEPGTVSLSTKLPITVMAIVLVAAFGAGTLIRPLLPNRPLRVALVLGWLLSLPTIILIILRDPNWDADLTDVSPGLDFLPTADWQMLLGFAVVGGAIIWLLGNPQLGEPGRVAAGIMVLAALAMWAFPMLIRLRVLGLLLAVFAVGAPTFGGDRRARLRYVAIWIGTVTLLVYFFAAINTPSSLTFQGKSFLGGLLLTFVLALTSIFLSFPIGVLMALGRTSTMPIFRVVSTAYIEMVRGIPFITVLIFFDLILVLFLPEGLEFDSVTLAILAGTLFSGAYLAENVRGGLQAIPKGQYEAARAMGLSTLQLTVFIVLPQALRAVVPALVGQTIAIFKDTSLVAIIGLFDFLFIADKVIPAQTAFLGVKLENLLFIAAVYWMFTFSFSRASLRIEKKLGLGER